jgi:hypothetical protein
MLFVFKLTLAFIVHFRYNNRHQKYFGYCSPNGKNMNNAKTLDGLTGKLKDPNPAVRLAGVHALGHWTDMGAVAPLRSALKDVDPKVRKEAEKSLERLWDKRVWRK